MHHIVWRMPNALVERMFCIFIVNSKKLVCMPYLSISLPVSYLSPYLLISRLYWKTSLLFSLLVLSNFLQSHGLQHARPPCLSPTPGASSNSRPLSQWCQPTISSSVTPFSSCPQSFPALGLFQWVSSLHQVAKVLELQHLLISRLYWKTSDNT